MLIVELILGFTLPYIAQDQPQPDPAAQAVIAELEAMTLSLQAEGENGWPFLAEAGAIMRDVRREWSRRDDLPPDWYGDLWFDAPYSKPTQEEEGLLDEALAQLTERGAFAALSKGIDAPNVVAPSSGKPGGGYLLHDDSGDGLRSLSLALFDSLVLSWQRDETDQLVATLMTVRKLARTASYQPGLYSRWLSMAIESRGLHTLSVMITEYGVDESTAGQLLKALDSIGPAEPAHVFRTEHILLRDSLDLLYSDERRNDGKTTQQALAEFGEQIGNFTKFLGPLLGREDGDDFERLGPGETYATREDVLMECDALYAKLIADAALPRHERRFFPDGLRAEIRRLGPRYFMLFSALPAAARTLDSLDEMQLRRDAVRIMLALEIHRAHHGQYPERLEHLVPAILPEIPIDARFGGEIHYRLLEHTDDFGRTYALYSVGADGEDNGGRIAEPHPAVAYEEERGTGFDLVINLPRSAYPRR